MRGLALAVLLATACVGVIHATPPAPTGDTVSVKLGGAPIKIREIRVKAPPIAQYGDTLSYRVENFADIADKTIGDVLRKMPGIEVAESGEIKYQGEAINRFYVEGTDLLGGRYGLATGNIAHHDVQSVELMENHQPVRALKDIAHSDRAALNLRLRPEAKGKWIGTAGLAGGTGVLSRGAWGSEVEKVLWAGSFFAMRIGRGWQSMQNLRLQNTGLNPAVENRSFSIAEMLGGNEGPLLPDRIDLGTGSAPIAERRTRFNHSTLANTTATRKFADDYELNLRLNYTGDRLSRYSGSHTTHYLADGENTIVEEQRTLTRRHDISAAARLEGNKERFYIKNELRVTWSWSDTRTSLSGTWLGNGRATLPTGSASNDFELVRRIGRRILTVTSQNHYQLNLHELTVAQGEVASRQTIREGAFSTHSNVAYGLTVGRWQLAGRAGVSLSTQSLRGELTGVDELSSGLPDNRPNGLRGDIATSNNSTLTTLRGYLTPTLTYRSPRLRGILTAPLSLYHYVFRDRTDRTDPSSRTSTRFISVPSLSLRWSASARWTLAGSTSAGHRQIDKSLIYNGLVCRDWRRFTSGTVDFGGGTMAMVTGSFEYKDPIRTLFFSGSVSRSWNRHRPMVGRWFIGEFILTDHTAEAARGATWSARAGGSKGIAGTKASVELETLWSRTTGEMRQNGLLVPYVSEVVFISPSFKGRLARWLNAELGLSLRRTRMSWRNLRNVTHSATGRLSLSVSPTKKLLVTLLGEHYASALGAGNFKNLWLADVGATWRPSQRWELTLAVTNLADERDYAYTLCGPLSSSSYIYHIRPREILLGASIRF